jgi:hypothetical protein
MQGLLILWHVIPLKTPFRLLIGFINHVQVVSTITYNTVTYFHNLHSLPANHFTLPAVVFAYSVSLSLKRLNSLQLFFTCELPVTVSYRELLCSADGLQDNPSAWTPWKRVALLLRVLLSSRCIAMVTARTHRKPVT